jgi:microcystin-dependent protein
MSFINLSHGEKMKYNCNTLIGLAFLFIGTTATAQDDTQAKINTILETLAAQEEAIQNQSELIEKLRKTVVPNIQPVGSIMFTASETAPAGYLYCDGAVLSRTEYSELFAAIGTTWGAGDGSATFNLPDMRGEFVRVWSKGHSVDSGRKLGQLQGQATAMPANQFSAVANGGHNHAMTASGTQATGSAGNHAHTESAAGNHQHQITIVERGSCSDTITTTSTGYYPGGGGSYPITINSPNPDVNARCNSSRGKTGIGYSTVSGSNSKPATAANKNGSIVAAGNHTHTIAANGAHTHTGPSHTHPLAAAPNHPHTITGGDAETRPRNQALSCFIKAFSNSAF